MAQLIGGLGTSHAPQLLMPALQWSDLPTRTKGPFNPKPDIAKELTDEAKLANQARCNKAIGALRAQLEAWAPDAVIVVQPEDAPQEVLVTFDGQTGTSLGTGQGLTIKASSHRVKIVRFTGTTFFGRMRRKLGWGGLAERDE